MGLPIKLDLESHDNGFHIYFWRLLTFWWTLFKAVISMKQTLVMHQWCPLYRDSTVASKKTRRVQPKILVLISNFISLNSTSIEIEGERRSSSQNERTKRTRANKVGRGVKTRESWANVLVKCPLGGLINIRFKESIWHLNCLVFCFSD